MKEIIDEITSIVKTATYRKEIQQAVIEKSPLYPDGSFIHQNAIDRLSTCGNRQIWKVYHDGSRKMISGVFCHQPKICAICARMASFKRCVSVMKWFNTMCKNGYLYNICLTVPDNENLFNNRKELSDLKNGIKDRRKLVKFGKYNDVSELIKFIGYFLKEEIKRGSGSGLWHAHYHGIAHALQMINYELFRLELNSIGGKHYNNFIKLMDPNDIKGILEAVKYSLKFSKDSSDIANLWDAYTQTKKQRMFNRYGTFLGLPEDEKEFSVCEDEKEYWVLILRYLKSGTFEPAAKLTKEQFLAQPGLLNNYPGGYSLSKNITSIEEPKDGYRAVVKRVGRDDVVGYERDLDIYEDDKRFITYPEYLKERNYKY